MQGFNELSLGDQEDQGVVDISVYDRVLKNPLLLSKIVGFLLDCPPAPREKKILLGLRLLSTGFNEAVLDAVNSSEQILIRLTMTKELDELSLAQLDRRLCRDVVMTCNNCDPPPSGLVSFFSTLVAERGSQIQILKIHQLVGVDLGTMLTHVNESCPNLTQLSIVAQANEETVACLTDWDGHFAVSMTALVDMEVSSNLQGGLVEKHVCRVVNILLQVSPNLQKLSIGGDFNLVIDTQKGLKSLKHTYFGFSPITFQSSRGLVQMINSVAATLETLENVNYTKYGSEFRMELEAHGLPTLYSFPCLKRLTLTGRKINVLSLKLWNHILDGGARYVETVVVQWFNYTHDQYQFWIPLSHEPEPLTSVTKLRLYGDLCDSTSQSERLRHISRAFPNLSEFDYGVGSGLENDGEDIEQVVREIFQELVVGWVTPIKKVEININRECSIHVVTAALDAIAQNLFTNGLATLIISAWRPYDREDLEAFTNDEQFDRLARMLHWTRHMESVDFHTFRIPANVAERLRDFISSNGLPVSFDRYEDEE